MKNFASMFIKSFFAIAILCAAASSPVMAQVGVGTGPMEVVRVEVLPGTTFSVKVSWERPTHGTLGAEIVYAVQLAEGANTAWVNDTGNNVPWPAATGGDLTDSTDSVTVAGVTSFDTCRITRRPSHIPGNVLIGKSFTYDCRDVANDPDHTLDVSYQGLKANTEYKVRVRAYSPRPVQRSYGKISDDVVFTIPDHVAMAPGDFTITEASDIGGHEFTVNWSHADNAQNYYVRWRTAETSAGGDEGLWQNAAGDAAECNDSDTTNDDVCGELVGFAPNSYRISGLDTGTEYEYQVRALNANTINAWVASPYTATTIVSDVARLKPPMVVKHGDDNTALPLQPAFHPNTLTYSVTLHNATSIKISAAVEVMEAAMQIGLAESEAGVDDSVTDSVVSGLSETANLVNIIVTAEDGSARTYTIAVTHAPARPRAEFLNPTVTARSGEPTPNLRILWNSPTSADTDYAIAVQSKFHSHAWNDSSGVTAIGDVAGAEQLPPGAQIAAVASPPGGKTGVDITGLTANSMFDVRLLVFGRITPLNAFASAAVEIVAAKTTRTLNNVALLKSLTPTVLLAPSEMTPVFSQSHLSYEVVYDRNSNFRLAVERLDPNSRSTGNGILNNAARRNHVGITYHDIVVTAEDGVTTTTYTVRAISPVLSIGLADITPTGGSELFTYAPSPMNSVTFNYTIGTMDTFTSVPSAVNSLDIVIGCLTCGQDSARKIGVRGFGEPQLFATSRDTVSVPINFGINHIDAQYASNGKEPVVYTFSVIRDEPTAPPPAVTFEAVSDIGENAFTINWQRLTDASEYFIRWRTAATDGVDGAPGGGDDVAAGLWQNAAGDAAECNDAANDDMCGEMIDGGAVSYAISGLLSGMPYDYSARAVNSIGAGVWTESDAAVTTTVSTDSSLATLTIDDGAGGNLITAFDPATTSYDLGMIPVGISKLAVTATVNEAAAKITRVTLDTGAIDGVTSGAEFSVDISGIIASGVTTGTIVISVTAGDGSSTDYTLTFTRAIPRAPDVNRDGVIDLTDGFLITRYLLGLRGDALIKDLSDDTTAAARIEAHMQTEVNAQTPTLDVNGDGQTTAADGILITRFLLHGIDGSDDSIDVSGLTAGQIDAATLPGNVLDNLFRSFNQQATL